MSTIPASSEQRVVLRSVSWETYLVLTEGSESGSGRITYDRGVLEIMSPGMPHEIAKRLIGRMIETFTLCRGIEIRSSSSTTFKRSEIQRGFEADESYYIQHASELRGVGEIDLSIHPPPDLVIEVDMTNSSIPKKGLFAAMKIPEVWRYDGVSLWMGSLYQDGYQDLEESLVLPAFPRGLASKLLDRQVEENETALMQGAATLDLSPFALQKCVHEAHFRGAKGDNEPHMPATLSASLLSSFQNVTYLFRSLT